MAREGGAIPTVDNEARRSPEGARVLVLITRFSFPGLNALNRVIKIVDAAGGQLWTGDCPWASDTVTNMYSYRMRTG